MMKTNLLKQALIISSASLLMLLSACAGGESIDSENQSLYYESPTEESAYSSSQNQFKNFQNQFNTFKGQIDSSFLKVMPEIKNELRSFNKVIVNETIESLKSNRDGISEIEKKLKGFQNEHKEINNNQEETIESLTSAQNTLETTVNKDKKKSPQLNVWGKTQPPRTFDYNSITLPETLIKQYEENPNLFGEQSRKVKQTRKQIYKQFISNTTDLIFELESEHDTPYLIRPCNQANKTKSHQYLYWLFLAPNLEITEANYAILARFFLGKIDELWIGKKWKLKEPALLKTIQGEIPQFKLVKQGRLILEK